MYVRKFKSPIEAKHEWLSACTEINGLLGLLIKIIIAPVFPQEVPMQYVTLYSSTLCNKGGSYIEKHFRNLQILQYRKHHIYECCQLLLVAQIFLLYY